MLDPLTIACIDYETIEILPDGSERGSTEAYRENFRVDSIAITWLNGDGTFRSEFLKGEERIGGRLQELAAIQVPLIAHNIQFEMLVSKCRFPDINLNWHADTMRLVQVYDNGGDKFAFTKIETLDDMLDAALGATEDDEGKKKVKRVKLEPISGLGLVRAVKRLLPPEFHDHKKEAHDWIMANVPEVKKGRVGQYLNRLPEDMLIRYNVADTENTFRLYLHCTQRFSLLKYDWTFDHSLFFSTVREVVDAKIRGVKVDRDSLFQYTIQVKNEIADIAKDFVEKFKADIALVERDRLLLSVMKRKTLRGRKKYLKTIKSTPEKWRKDVSFNVGSNKQLEQLFVGKMKIKAKFSTDKGNPSFRSAVLSQWGDGGEMLKKRRKRLLVLKQAEALHQLSAYDGRWRPDFKACGTSTGRMAGGSH